MMFKYLLIPTLLLSSAVTFATTQDILIRLDKDDPKFTESPRVYKSDINFKCPGRNTNEAYRYEDFVKHKDDGFWSGNLRIAGPFTGDPRTSCTSANDTVKNKDGGTSEPYYVLNPLIVRFSYDGNPANRCIINVNVGQTYSGGPSYDANQLVANVSNNTAYDCADNTNGTKSEFKYIFTIGGTNVGIYKKGHITIYHK